MPADECRIRKSYFRIPDFGQFQTAGRSCHSEIQPVQGGKSSCESIRFPLMKPDFSQSTGNNTNHVIKKSVTADKKRYFISICRERSAVNCPYSCAGGSAGGLESCKIMRTRKE